MRVLSFNLTDDQNRILRSLCESLGLNCKVVPPEGFALPIGAMAGIPLSARHIRGNEHNFSEPMLVMCNLDQMHFDRFLTALRRSPLPPIGLKAVLTPTNAAWSACQLYEELCREREAFLKGLRGGSRQ